MQQRPRLADPPQRIAGRNAQDGGVRVGLGGSCHASDD